MTTVGRWSPNKVRARVLDGTWPEPLGGMVLVKPTSVDKAGTGSTATIGANGSVEFSACTSLSLNGVFTTDYDNYMIVIRGASTVSGAMRWRLRTAGSDSSTNYTYQNILANGTAISGSRFTAQTSAYLMWADSAQRYGGTLVMFGPNLAQPTAYRTTPADSYLGAEINDLAGTHSESTSYDGMTIILDSGTFTGLISVYGLVGT